MDNLADILKELKRLQGQLSEVMQSQSKLKSDMRMIFYDITKFENMVIKILDNTASHSFHWERGDDDEDDDKKIH